MTLAKKHYQRLWYPEPGTGGAIPSRAEHGLTQAEFDARHARRSSGARWWTAWRAEAPDTLLLAEAFWLMEGYFVRTLGMHRVYNSAFMNMLRDEENAKYRSVDQEHARVRPGDPEALRQLHEQPGRADRGRAVRQGRQVLRRLHADGHAAGPAHVRPRPGRGLRREVRHGVPPRLLGRAARRVAGRAPRARDLPAAAPARACSPRSRDFLLYDLVHRRRLRSTRTSSPTRTATATSARWSSTTTATPPRAAGSGSRAATR